MRNKASAYLKQILSLMSGMVKTKSMALKSKTNAIKTRLTILSLIKNKKVFLGSLSDKVNSILHHEHDRIPEHEHSRAMVMHSAAMANEWQPSQNYTYPDDLVGGEYEYEYDYEYECGEQSPDLTHTMFESDCEECEEELQKCSVIDLVKRSKEEVDEEFNLENDIDQVADLFINRFHRQLKLQKQQSIKRYQEMLNRSI